MELNRQQILVGFLENLWRIADKNYQRRVWIEARGPECHSFDDAICDFFGDGEGILEKYREFGLTDTQHKVLEIFTEKFQMFSDNNDFPELFIDTSEWNEITEMAKEVLKAFNYPPKK